MSHQFSLFGWVKPIAKIPISKQRIEELKAAIESGDKQLSKERMRSLLDHVQNIEKRIHNGKYLK